MRPINELQALLDKPDNDLTTQELRVLAFHQGWKNVCENSFIEFTHSNPQYEQSVRFWSDTNFRHSIKLMTTTGNCVFQGAEAHKKLGIKSDEIFDFIGNFEPDTSKHASFSVRKILQKSMEVFKNRNPQQP